LRAKNWFLDSERTKDFVCGPFGRIRSDKDFSLGTFLGVSGLVGQGEAAVGTAGGHSWAVHFAFCFKHLRFFLPLHDKLTLADKQSTWTKVEQSRKTAAQRLTTPTGSSGRRGKAGELIILAAIKHLCVGLDAPWPA
jgi:hypothetical protein